MPRPLRPLAMLAGAAGFALGGAAAVLACLPI